MCNGQGTFGFKCLKCNKFTYRFGNETSSNLQQKHLCSDLKICNCCKERKEPNHLCKLSKEALKQSETKLAFITFEHFDNSSENCIQCEQGRNKTQNFCNKHKSISENLDQPLMVIIYYEEKTRGVFTKYELNNFERPQITKSENILVYNYAEELVTSNVPNATKKKKIIQDFKTNFEKLQSKQTLSLTDVLLQLILNCNFYTKCT